jgi:threonine dehydrogenase-like Zn-dependent dehydrogenase
MKSRVAMQTGVRKLELREVEVPPAPEPGGAILAVEANGICGSDYEQYRGAMAGTGLVSYPLIPGHEIVGRIDSIDDDAALAWGIGEGARVAVSSIATCGRCDACKAGRPKFCRQRFIYGFTPMAVGSGLWGGYSEYMCLRPQTTLYEVDEGLSAEDAVLFNPLGAAFDWIVKAAGVGVGVGVLVIGAGQRGLASVIAAAEAGASPIVLAGRGRNAWKLELGRRLGATEVIDLDQKPLVESVLELTGGAGIDRVLDTTPAAAEPLLEAIAAVREEGTVVSVGIKGGPIAGFDPDRLAMKAITLRGVFGGSEWGEREALRVLAGGRYDVSEMHTHSIGLEEIGEMLERMGGEDRDRDPLLHVSVRP